MSLAHADDDDVPPRRGQSGASVRSGGAFVGGDEVDYNGDRMSKVIQETTPIEQMIREQLVGRGITDSRVIDAMRSVPRPKFFPTASQGDAFAGRAAPIGFGQTISEPYIVALMTEKLKLDPAHRVLEIG